MTDEPIVPEPIRVRLAEAQDAVAKVGDAARAIRTIQIPPTAFHYRHLLPGADIMTSEERAQSIGFVTRFDGLPPPAGPICSIDEEGNVWLDNESYMRHTLNEFRPIVMNQSDSVYYLNMHRAWRDRLTKPHTALELVVRAESEEGDITPRFVEWLDQTKDAIKFILKSIDLGFLYNGVLQHSGPDHSARFVAEYMSGELSWRLLKAANLLWDAKHFLVPYYRLAHTLNFPRPGPLGRGPAPATRFPRG